MDKGPCSDLYLNMPISLFDWQGFVGYHANGELVAVPQ